MKKRIAHLVNSFEDLVVENINTLYNVALRFTHKKEDAQDLVQDTVMRAYRFFHIFEQVTNFKAWILRIMRNLFINSYRKRIKEPKRLIIMKWIILSLSGRSRDRMRELWGRISDTKLIN